MATRKTVKAEPAERTEICKNCRFSHYKRGEELRCRRFPPVFVYDYPTGTSNAQWPETNADAWCGEYKPLLND
jgi:hypothetical protein